MSDGTEAKETMGHLPTQAFKIFPDYRMYITPEAYVITYRDADLVRILRNTEHKPGFLLLVAEIFSGLLIGRRTDVRDHWSIWAAGYEKDAEILDLKSRAAPGAVLEFSFEKSKPIIKEKDR